MISVVAYSCSPNFTLEVKDRGEGEGGREKG